MFLQILAALTLGGALAAITLWWGRFGTTPVIATERLQRIRNEEESAGNPLASLLALRKRAGSIRFGGVNVVSGSITQRWANDLQHAGLTLNVREYFILRVVVALIFVVLLMMLLPIPQLGLLGAPLGYLAVGLWLKRRITQRTRKLEGQLVELLQMLASGLRAGFGLLQAMDAAGEQLPAPISVEIRRTMRDIGMGSSVEKALAAMNDRIGSNDFDIVITAILIQRNVGGNLAEILDNVAHTMRERERIKGEIRTLTSQQRLTGYVIGGIPIGLLIFFSMINPEFTSLLFTDSLGQMLIGAGAVMWVIGFLVIKKIVDIEV